MIVPYAEVIGDPVAQSRSPLIHDHWLRQCGIAGRFEARRVTGPALAAYLEERARDPDWRGCSVTLPHKESALRLLDRLDDRARGIGAINCIHREGEALIGCNTDVDGIAHALAGVPVEGRAVAVIGAGGAARAAIAYLLEQGVGAIRLIVRDPARAETLAAEAPDTISLRPMRQARRALSGAALIVNASPLGMTGAAAMPAELLLALARDASGATFFDMVYEPRRTPFLQAGATAGATTVEGLAMLIGQARPAFRLFFGHTPPAGDGALLALLSGQDVASQGQFQAGLG